MDHATGLTRVLGIESSCDETAAAVVACDAGGRGSILSNIVFSQIEAHAAFGGVVPEIAARVHVEKLDGTIEAALLEAELSLSDVDAVAVTGGPGLIGGLIAGLMTAKAIAAGAEKPLYTINHLEGHALTARLTDGIGFPYLLLLVSGGHTQILLVGGVGNYKRLASTIDDAVGEAFDKTAKLLGLSPAGGQAVEAAANGGNPARFRFPRPLKGEARPDFSFSGLKTAVRRVAEENAPLGSQDVADICAGFQAAVGETVVDRLDVAMAWFRSEFPDMAEPVLVAAGGVAANGLLRDMLQGLCASRGFRFVAPPLPLCSDNAAMIAWAALERIGAGLPPGDAMAAAPRSRWPLDDVSSPMLGGGKRGAKA